MHVGKLVDTNMITGKAPHRALQYARIIDAIQFVTKAKKASLDTELQTSVVEGGAIPKILHGTLWTFPSNTQLAKLRTHTLATLWGRWRAMRCAEIVFKLLNTVTRVDPVAANNLPWTVRHSKNSDCLT